MASLWVGVCATTATVQFLRGAIVDSVLFTLAGVALLLDATGRMPVTGRLPRPSARVIALAAVPCAIGLILAPRHTVQMGLIVILVGIGVLPFAWAGTRPRSRAASDCSTRQRNTIIGQRSPSSTTASKRRRTSWAWAGVLVVISLVELSSWVIGRIDPLAAATAPSISELLDGPLDSWRNRAVFVVVWLAFGVVLFRRGSERA
ncbi:hypothetical protein [Ruicaihuangia caeni]|uniref:DUF998 domain-containing protein n=1 Tax=Ruicaihuangia caeni TaxID=3042517 RepID=A0AAW6T241_9MICO|nr:hypothetical protein [Klugiella sp. YN-L-19]MDI2097852.1 hypothetical protein [Klugiella sp. YN-L-19]